MVVTGFLVLCYWLKYCDKENKISPVAQNTVDGCWGMIWFHDIEDAMICM